MNQHRHTQQPLPEPTLRRLPWYLAYIERISAKGVKHVSTTTMSQALNVVPAQIAKDLSMLNLRGRTRIGYSVEAIKHAMTDVLGFHRHHRALIFGAGSLGKALMQDDGLERYGLHIVAAFDSDKKLAGTSFAGTPIYHIDQLPELQRELAAYIGILTVPVQYSNQTAELAISHGIRAIWNFTPVKLKCPSHVVVADTSIYADLALIYNGITENAI